MERIEKLQKMLVSEPADPFLMHALALEHIKAGNDPAAERLFIEILSRNPGYVGSYYHLGRLLERNGRLNDAMEWYEKGMKTAREQGDGHSYNELQTALEDINDT